jgi:hypothetical protein
VLCSRRAIKPAHLPLSRLLLLHPLACLREIMSLTIFRPSLTLKSQQAQDGGIIGADASFQGWRPRRKAFSAP